MALTNAQALLLKAEINGDATLAAQPDNGTGSQFIADALNLLAAPAFPVWRTSVPTQEIFDAINWALYTPTGAVDDATLSTALIAQQRTAQLMVIQTKQLNLQNMTLGRVSVDASKANIRLGLRDAVIQVPAGAAGVAVAPGGASGATVLNICTRSATRAEKVLVQAGGALQTGTVSASLLGFEGAVSSGDVNQARNAV